MKDINNFSAAAAAFWLAVWQCAAMAVGQEVFLVSPVQAVRTFAPFAAGRVLAAGGFQFRCWHSAGFWAGVAVSIVLAVAAQAWHTADVLLAPVLQLVKATPWWQALSFWRWCGCGGPILKSRRS